jgi:hypothetical protein
LETLGYFPKLPSTKKVGHNIGALHRSLDVMLSGLAKAQWAGGLKAPVLVNNGQEFRLCFKVPVCHVIGDVEGHNEICTCYSSHQTYSLAQECDCTTESSDDPDVVCNYVNSLDTGHFWPVSATWRSWNFKFDWWRTFFSVYIPYISVYIDKLPTWRSDKENLGLRS